MPYSELYLEEDTYIEFGSPGLPYVQYFRDATIPRCLEDGDWLYRTHQDISDTPAPPQNDPVELIRDYNRARSFQGDVIGALGLNAAAAFLHATESHEEPPKIGDFNNDIRDTDIHNFLNDGTDEAEHGFSDWFIQETNTVANAWHDAYSGQKDIFFLSGSGIIFMYALLANEIKTHSGAHLRSFLDKNGLPEKKVSKIRRAHSLNEASSLLVAEASEIAGMTVPHRVMQHDNWSSNTQPPKPLLITPERENSALGNTKGDRIDNTLSHQRIALGYYCVSRHAGLDPEAAYNALFAHGPSFAAHQSAQTSDSAAFKMRTHGWPDMTSSAATMTDNIRREITGSAACPETSAVTIPGKQSTRGRCPASVGPKAQTPKIIDEAFEILANGQKVDPDSENKLYATTALFSYGALRLSETDQQPGDATHAQNLENYYAHNVR